MKKLPFFYMITPVLCSQSVLLFISKIQRDNNSYNTDNLL